MFVIRGAIYASHDPRDLEEYLSDDDLDSGDYRFLVPAYSGDCWAVDCWIVNEEGEPAPSVAQCPVPFYTDALGDIVGDTRE